jgi:hypothetical protein
MYIYALLGLELFAYKAKFDSDHKVDILNGEPPINNFDTFFHSFLTVFVILTNDGWTGIYFDYYRATSGAGSIIYFISLMVVG